MIVPRFTSFVEDFVISRYQVTNFFDHGTESPVRLLKGTLVFLVHLQNSLFWILGK